MVNMVSFHIPRQSTSSEHTSNSTAIDSHSAQHSPRMTDEVPECGTITADTVSPAESCPLHNGIRKLSRPVPGERHGWPQLAQIMSDVPEFAAFSRFRELNVKNLLYYQAELNVLQEEIAIHEEERTLDVKCYEDLVEEANSCYHGLLMKNRRLLREYNEALLQFTKISALPDPDTLNMRTLRTWLKSRTGGGHRIFDRYGPDVTWGNLSTTEPAQPLWTQCWEVFWALIFAKAPPASDGRLVVTQPSIKIDGLTKWVGYHLVPLWWEAKEVWAGNRKINPLSSDVEHTQTSPQNDKGTVTGPGDKSEIFDTLESISEHTALRLTSGLTTVVACLMPVVAIAVLTQVSGTRDLLLCITGFAVLFAILLIFLTQGTSSRTEIFAATAAFSAVLVVFISQPVNDISCPRELNHR